MHSIIISDKPYASWLAESLANIDDINADAIAITAIDVKKHEVITGYYNCSMQDKAIIATNIQSDALYDSILANADQIIKRAEEIEEERQ